MINEMGKQQFLATFDAPMRFVETEDDLVPQVKIGDYVDECITALGLPTNRKDIDIHRVYMNDAKGFCHILLNWGVKNTYLVVITKPFEEAIHQGDREAVLEKLAGGYDPDTEGIPGHTAVSYAAKCRRLQILKDLVEHGGQVKLHAIRSSLAKCPIDIAWEYAERNESVANTFAYLFWEKAYFLRLLLIPLILLVGIIGTIAVRRKRRDVG